MTRNIKDLVPTGTEEETIKLLVTRTTGWIVWNKSCFQTFSNIEAFLSIDEKYCTFLGQQKMAAIDHLLQIDHYDRNQVLAFCQGHNLSLEEAMRNLDDQRQKLGALKGFKSRLDALNGIPYGALYAFAPTGIKIMAAELAKFLIVTGPQVLHTRPADHAEANKSITAAEKYLRSTAQEHLDNPPTSRIPLTGRSHYVETLYKEIVSAYAHHAPAPRRQMVLRKE